jgi:hypothetical protein
MTPEEVASTATVQRWFASARYDDDPPEEREQRYALLAAFCEHTGQTPDELVKGLFRTTKAGDTAISAKRREAMNVAIEEFVKKQGLTGREATVTGNTLRGFLIHNGVFIQGGVWRGG